jgi:hypothetical protein
MDHTFELANWQAAGHLAKVGPWRWTAEAPGNWDKGLSEYSSEGAAILGRRPQDLTMGMMAYIEQVIHPADAERIHSFCLDLNAKGTRTYT